MRFGAQPGPIQIPTLTPSPKRRANPTPNTVTNIKSGGNEASYSAALTETHHSMIIANYGASQGFDVRFARNRPSLSARTTCCAIKHPLTPNPECAA